MVFHTFGEKSDPVVLLIHGMLTPWQIWDEAIAHFSKEYYVIVPELDAHTLEQKSKFDSVEKEAEILRDYLISDIGGEVYLLCGLSMGGRIAATLGGMPGIKVKNLVLDGAPLLSLPKVMIGIMKSNYRSVLQRSVKRDSKMLESARKSFLPEKHIPEYLRIADQMEEESVERILDSVFGKAVFPKYEGCRVLFMHGTKGNETLSKKAALKMKAVNPQTQINCYRGYNHAQLACFEPEKWVEEVERWLKLL